MVTKWALRAHRAPSVPLLLDCVPLGIDAQDVLRDAAKEAQALGYDNVRTCHLLLALTDAPGRGIVALERLGVTREAVREQIEILDEEMSKIEGGSVDVEIAGDEVCLSRRTNDVVEEAMQEAWVYGRAYAMPYDLLLVLTKGRSGSTSDKVFDGLGLTVALVHSQVIRRRVEPRDHEVERRVRHIDDILAHWPPTQPTQPTQPMQPTRRSA